MWIFSKPAEQLTEDDLQSLITNGVRENAALEFKRQMYDRRDPSARLEMLRDVTSIANAEGGALILGMDEDGAGTARALLAVPDAETEANRLVSACLSSLADRITGLKATRVPIAGGNVIVVTIPRSYRRPHMVIADGVNELWVRHDRQKSKMTVAEIRAAVTATEELEIRAASFIAGRRSEISNAAPGMLFSLMATPILLEDGRIDVGDGRRHDLLRNPPAFRQKAGAMALSSSSADVTPALKGLQATQRNASRLDLFRNGHIEFVITNAAYFSFTRQGTDRVEFTPWAIAELLRSLTHFVDRLRHIVAITDPYLYTVSIWRCRGVFMPKFQVEVWGFGESSVFNETDLMMEPMIASMDEAPDATARRLADRFWNAFNYMACPFFNDNGQFFIP